MNLICFSHLRWDFVYQRPQHLLSFFSREYTVYYIEECVLDDAPDGYYIKKAEANIFVVTPHLKTASDTTTTVSARIESTIKTLFTENEISEYYFWYYTPMALQYSNSFNPLFTVYDCMDELSAFKFAPPLLKELEQELLKKADIVFTGGHSLYSAKKNQHSNIHPFPSSIDKEHFGKARFALEQFADQELIPHPRLGFFGVIDERFDIELIKNAATLKPDWHFVLIGPVVKIDPLTLPVNSNIHYLGSKSYSDLPVYLSGWDIALIPFAINESTRYISPTKTPEYLAAGKPVLSTPIADVVNPYATQELVSIVKDATEFVTAATAVLENPAKKEWLMQVDSFLSGTSWEDTWLHMILLIANTYNQKELFTNKTENDVRFFNSRSRTGRVGISRKVSGQSK